MKGHTHKNESGDLCITLPFNLYYFTMNGLQRGILTEMSPRFMRCVTICVGHFFVKPLQDEWVTKGHTDSNSQT